MSLVLVILGFGLGLSAVSPWSGLSASAETIGVSTIVWVAFTQIAASALGGYLAGRLRVKWASLHSDEVYFRDTAHGFMAWAVASLVTAAFLASAISTAIGSGVQASATVASGVAVGAGAAAHRVPENQVPANGNATAGDAPLNYFVDGLFRTDAAATADAAAGAASRREAAAIFSHDLIGGDLTAEDKAYLGQIVARQTGLNQADAEKRVSDQYTQLRTSMANAANEAKQLVDKARKAAAYSSLWMFIALMCGAFFASLAATFGGKRRDHVV